jgi:transcriptional regulator with XRE-family HTH domain
LARRAALFNDCGMSPRSAVKPPTPAATALAGRTAVAIGTALRDERQRRRWTMEDVAARARISKGTVCGVEAGRQASLDTYARLAVALGLNLDVTLADRRRRAARESGDVVHAAMGELEVRWLTAFGYELAIDRPYQHYQFAGRADVLAWTIEPAHLLHIENRTRFPDLQSAAGSYNAKREYLGAVLARQVGIRRFDSETHVMAGLWSAEVIHSVRLRAATFQALCPDREDRLAAWLAGQPPRSGRSSSFVLLDPLTKGRQSPTAGLTKLLACVRPRLRDYRDAAERLTSAERQTSDPR